MSSDLCPDYHKETNLTGTTPCNRVNGSVNTHSGEVYYDSFGYLLTTSSTDAFLALFTIVTAIQILLTVYWRNWYTFATLCLGGLTEVLGWLGRYLSRTNTYWNINNGGGWYFEKSWFIMQVTCLIIAPVFFSAANYVLLGRIIKATGNRWTSITSVSFATIFVTGDIVCLSIQGAGGGIAGSAITDANANKGAYIMTGGVITQLVVTLCFVVVWAEFIYRYYLNKPVNKQYDFIATLPNWMVPRPMRSSNTGAIGEKKRSNSLSPTSSDVESAGVHRSTSVEVSPGKVTLYLTVLAATTLLIVVRSVYRSIELLGGWNGSIETNQNLFIALDASLMLVVLVIYSVFPPGMFDGTRFF